MANYEGMLAETVLINGHEGTQIDAYLARPLGAGPTGAVVLIHHMPGWDEASKEMARKLAYNGYTTISPNLHFRQGQATPQDNSASIRDAGGMPDASDAPWPAHEPPPSPAGCRLLGDLALLGDGARRLEPPVAL